MIVIPYFWKTKGNTMQLGIFLSKGGSTLWSIGDNEDINAVLIANGFPTLSLSVSDDGIVYAQIDHDTVDMSGFYTTNEPDIGDKDVWHCIDVPMDILGLPEFLKIFYRLTNTIFVQGMI
jgi:hypothetical protein